jgi:hypothetical protein
MSADSVETTARTMSSILTPSTCLMTTARRLIGLLPIEVAEREALAVQLAVLEVAKVQALNQPEEVARATIVEAGNSLTLVLRTLSSEPQLAPVELAHLENALRDWFRSLGPDEQVALFLLCYPADPRD